MTIRKITPCGWGVERIHRSGHPWTKQESQNWSKICGGALWMMVKTFFDEELKEKISICCTTWGKWNGYLIGNSGKTFWIFLPKSWLRIFLFQCDINKWSWWDSIQQPNVYRADALLRCLVVHEIFWHMVYRIKWPWSAEDRLIVIQLEVNKN